MTSVVVATDRPTLKMAHGDIAGWVERRLAAIASDAVQAEADLTAARERKWGTTALARQVRKLRAHEAFLLKIRGALSAGYSLVPNFDLELLAVRTDKEPSTAQDGDRPTVGAARLAVGHGEFVSPEPEFVSWEYDWTGPKGDKCRLTAYRATEHAPIDVPVVLMKADLAASLQQAMQEKIFDEIGIVKDRKRDPVLVGRVLHPKASHWNRQGICFFIGWWFDTRALEA